MLHKLYEVLPHPVVLSPHIQTCRHEAVPTHRLLSIPTRSSVSVWPTLAVVFVGGFLAQELKALHGRHKAKYSSSPEMELEVW